MSIYFLYFIVLYCFLFKKNVMFFEFIFYFIFYLRSSSTEAQSQCTHDSKPNHHKYMYILWSVFDIIYFWPARIASSQSVSGGTTASVMPIGSRRRRCWWFNCDKASWHSSIEHQKPNANTNNASNSGVGESTSCADEWPTSNKK